jgi:multidrug resistance efflux pump
MLIILALYAVLIWLVFSRLKLVRLNWGTGTVAAFAGALILAIFLGMFNYLTPSGKFVIISRVAEITPNVSGTVLAIPVKTNVPVKTGTVLFQIDKAPFQSKVRQLDASLAGSKQQALQLKASYEQATANVAALDAQLRFHQQRLKDTQQLLQEGAATQYREQDVQDQVNTTAGQLQAAIAVQLNAKLAMDSEIGGENTTVAQIQAQLETARWELEQTTILAPADGYVSTMALAIGDRALQTRSAMSFIVADDIAIIGMFPPNGFQVIHPGAAAKLVFDNDPGRVFEAKIVDIPRGVGQGQVAVSGTLARVGSIGGANAYPAEISIPDGVERTQLRLGMPGTATVFSDKAGVIGILMSILVWVSSYTAYL